MLGACLAVACHEPTLCSMMVCVLCRDQDHIESLVVDDFMSIRDLLESALPNNFNVDYRGSDNSIRLMYIYIPTSSTECHVDAIRERVVRMVDTCDMPPKI